MLKKSEFTRGNYFDHWQTKLTFKHWQNYYNSWDTVIYLLIIYTGLSQNENSAFLGYFSKQPNIQSRRRDPANIFMDINSMIYISGQFG